MSGNGSAVKKTAVRKICIAAFLCASGVLGSALNFPIGASKCCPMQAIVNVTGGIILGPWYSLLVAFVTSVIRNITGTGTVLAFPGSMFGAFFAGFLFDLFRDKNKKTAYFMTFIGEIFGTGILGALAAYPAAVYLLGKEAAVFGYVVPFLISSAGGTVIAALLVTALDRIKFFDKFLGE